MPEDKSVKDSDSPDGKKSGSNNPSDEGKSPSDPKEMTAAQFIEILKKKDKAIDDMRSRIDEIENKDEEEEEEPEPNDPKEQIKKDARSKPWLDLNREISEEVAGKAKWEMNMEMAQDYLDDVAENEGISDSVDLKKFNSTLVTYMRYVDPEGKMKPYRRAKEAFKAFSKDRKEMTEKRKDSSFSENQNQKPVRVPTKDELLKEAKTSPKKLEELLRGISDVHQERTAR